MEPLYKGQAGDGSILCPMFLFSGYHVSEDYNPSFVQWLSSFNRVLYMYGHHNAILIHAVNVRGSFLMTKYSLPEMKKNNYGRILLIASIDGKKVHVRGHSRA